MSKKQTWDNRYKEWRSRMEPGNYDAHLFSPRLRTAYDAGRRHQREVCREKAMEAAKQSEANRAGMRELLAEEFNHSAELLKKKNEYQVLCIVLRRERGDMNFKFKKMKSALNYYKDKCAPKWWQFWKKFHNSDNRP